MMNINVVNYRQLSAITVIIFLSVLIIALAGCAGDKQKTIEIDIRELADTIINEGSFDDNQLAAVEEGAFLDMYFIEQPETVLDFIVYASAGSSAEEVAVIHASNTGAAADIQSSAKKRIERIKEGVENYRDFFGDDYVSNEMPKLGNAVLTVKGTYVIMCASKDSVKAKAIIDDFFENI